jgi:nitroreductase
VVRNPDLKTELAKAAFGQLWLAEAPVVIGVCAVPARTIPRYGKRGRDLYCIQDTAAATEHILLAVTALGLGACWVGAFDEHAAATVLDLPEELRLLAMVPIGYPAQPSSRVTSRRSVSEVSECRV